MEEAIEFEERLFVKGNEVKVMGFDAGFREAIVDGVARKGGVVFFSGEALFLGGGEEATVLEEARGTIVVER
jgi:hypothetical protein